MNYLPVRLFFLTAIFLFYAFSAKAQQIECCGIQQPTKQNPEIQKALSAGKKVTAFIDDSGAWKIAHPEDFLFGKSKKESNTLLAGISGIQFNVVFNDVVSSTGNGFDDNTVVGSKTLGQIRRETFFAVLDYLNSVLDESGTCDIEVNFSRMTTTPPIATGGMLFTFGNGPEFNPGNAFLHIKNGAVDPSRDTTPDIILSVNFGFEINSDLDTPTPTEFDLFSLMLHEITHGLGLFSLTNGEGASIESPQKFTRYDDFLYSFSGTKLWDSTTGNYLPPNNFPLRGTNGDGSVFKGLKASTEFGGNPALHTPAGFFAQSSMSHWVAQLAGPNQPVMDPFFQSNNMKREYQRFEIFTLADLGYKIRGASTGAIVINEIRYDDAGGGFVGVYRIKKHFPFRN